VDFIAFSAINGTLLVMYGPRGGRGLARRSAWLSFAGLLKELEAFSELAEMAHKPPSIDTVLEKGLPAIAAALDDISDQRTTVEVGKDYDTVIVERCPACWGLETSEPCCHAVSGWLEESLRWLSGGEAFEVTETHCKAMGDNACQFRISKQPL
jgi:predicted hydrocarbon binding protein